MCSLRALSKKKKKKKKKKREVRERSSFSSRKKFFSRAKVGCFVLERKRERDFA